MIFLFKILKLDFIYALSNMILWGEKTSPLIGENIACNEYIM